MRDLITRADDRPADVRRGQGISAPRADAPARLSATADASTPARTGQGLRLARQLPSVDDQTLTFDEMKERSTPPTPGSTRSRFFQRRLREDAVRAGADSIEHGIDLDEETIADMVKRGTVWVPTIDHNPLRGRQDEFGFADDTIRRSRPTSRRTSTRPVARQGWREARHGFRCGLQHVRPEHHELGWFVKAGMTPAQALATATTIPAALLGHAADLGAIAPGCFADLVAVDGDPLADVDVVISKVRWVKGGALCRQGEVGWVSWGGGPVGRWGGAVAPADGSRRSSSGSCLPRDHEVDKSRGSAPKSLIGSARTGRLVDQHRAGRRRLDCG
jgi:hypothetical protein